MLAVVELVPRGRVTSYGLIAEVVGGGPRRVGHVLSQLGGTVPWWRVVRADGSLPPPHQREAMGHYRAEGTALTRSGRRVDMDVAGWDPLLHL